MCGIVYTRRFDGHNANNIVKKRFKKQKSRGKKGFGMVTIDGVQMKDVYRSVDEGPMMSRLDDVEATEIMFHHRMPTSTSNVKSSTHPVKVSHPTLEYDYFVIHNGNISNADDLKEQHEEIGFEYTTEMVTITETRLNKWKNVEFNDTEALAIDLALAIEDGDDSLDARGSIATVCLQVDKETQEIKALHYGRNNSNPLVREYQKGQFFTLKSQGQGEKVDAHTLHTVDNEHNEAEQRDFDFGNRAVGYGRNHNYNTGAGQTNWGDDWGTNKDNENNEAEEISEVLEEPSIGDIYHDEIGDRYEMNVRTVQFLKGFQQACEKQEQLDSIDGSWIETTANQMLDELHEIEEVLNAMEEVDAPMPDEMKQLQTIEQEYWAALNASEIVMQ